MGVDDELLLGRPIELLAGARELEVTIESAGDSFDDVCGVGGDLGGDEAFTDIFGGGEAEVFCGCHIAEEVSACGCRNGSSDGRDNVVIAWGDVGDEGAENIEGRLVADTLLELDIHLHLIEWDMAGAFDHDLNAGFPGELDEFPKGKELLDLGTIGGVEDGARTETVAKTQGDVVFAGDGEESVVVGIKRVFFIIVEHPGEMKGTPARDDVCDPSLFFKPVDCLLG